ncbi:MAG: GIDE domain-containing protein, partial [Gammaproteobacteria bacterium]
MIVSASLAHAIAGAEAGKFSLFAGIGVLLALALSWGAYSMLIRKRVLQDTPTALIRSASQGYIELQGHAELIDGLPILAPLSAKRCVWFDYRVEKKERRVTSGSNSRSEWRTIESGTSDSLFYLVDSTGRCAVDPEGAKVTASSRDIWYGNSRYPGRIDTSSGWLHFTGLTQIGRQFRYTEKRIEPGDPLYALGDFTTHSGAGADFDRNAEVREILREWKQNHTDLLARFDADKDGNIDIDEWEAARAAAGQEVDTRRAHVSVAPPVDVLGHTRGSRNPFIIAAKTEAEMLARFHWSAIGL